MRRIINNEFINTIHVCPVKVPDDYYKVNTSVKIYRDKS